MNFWQFEFFDVVCYVRIYLVCQINKMFFWVGVDMGGELIEWNIECSRKCFLVIVDVDVVGVMNFFWIGLDCFNWYVDCQWMFGMVGNYIV